MKMLWNCSETIFEDFGGHPENPLVVSYKGRRLVEGEALMVLTLREHGLYALALCIV